MPYFSHLLADIPGIQHAFLTAAESAAFDKTEIVDIKQVHGTDILTLTQRPDNRPQVDGIFTAMNRQKVAVVTADCLPLLMASKDGRFVCSIHAGWKGLTQGIVQRAVQQFTARGTACEDIVVAVGPHIGPCCYEVSAGFYPMLLTTAGGELARQHYAQLFLSHPRQPHTLSATPREFDSLWFDLSAFCALQLQAAGIVASQTDWLAICTYCTPQALGSYRRRTHFPAVKTQQLSWIMRSAES